MSRTFKKQPKSERIKKVKRDDFKKTSLKHSVKYDLQEDENEIE